MEIKIRVGEIGSRNAKLMFDFVSDEYQVGSLTLIAFDPSDMRKSGIFMALNGQDVRKLRQILDAADQAAEKLKKNDQLKVWTTN